MEPRIAQLVRARGCNVWIAGSSLTTSGSILTTDGKLFFWYRPSASLSIPIESVAVDKGQDHSMVTKEKSGLMFWYVNKLPRLTDFPVPFIQSYDSGFTLNQQELWYSGGNPGNSQLPLC